MAGYAVSILKINAVEVSFAKGYGTTGFHVQVKLFNFSNGNEIQREMLQPSKA